MRAAGAVAGLDATEQGRPIYLPLGFHDLYKISRWHLDRVQDGAVAPPGRASRSGRFAMADLPKLATYDRPLSGMERPTMLAHLATRQPGLACGRGDGVGQARGLCAGPRRPDRDLDRAGGRRQRGHRAGADREGNGLGARRRSSSTCRMHIARSGRGWKRQGAVSPRGYMRMTLGTAKGLDDPSHVFALAGPELG